MTCIIGLVEGGKTYMGADSAAVSGVNICTRKDEKIFHSPPFLIGFTTSFRMGQLLRYSLKIRGKVRNNDIFKFMCTHFVDACRESFKAGGWSGAVEGRENGGCFLVAYKNRLFTVESDFQVGEVHDKYAALGSGDLVAMGAMHATQTENPIERINRALSASECFISSVRRPFYIYTMQHASGKVTAVSS